MERVFGKSRRWEKLYENLNRMLDDAIAGSFEESVFDESELSKLETKWKRYLTMSRNSRQKTEEDRQRIQEMVTDISHQTKTPLANILLYTQLLEEKPLDEEAKKIVAEIAGQSAKLEFLIQSLVKISRLESGTFCLFPEKKDVSALTEAVAELIRGKAEQKRIRICGGTKDGAQAFADDGPIYACFDEKWTQEALFNIADNAVKYSGAGSTVRIGIRAGELFVRIEIADEGIGIPEEEIPKIFGRFYRGERVRMEEGVGIGLYLARKIIESEGGYIKVVSTPGKGSRFQVFLPRA